MVRVTIFMGVLYLYVFSSNVEAFRRILMMKDATSTPKSNLQRYQKSVTDITSRMMSAALISATVISKPPAIHADSTGKFSSKMTAKKRYLPRIQTGVAKFNEMIGSDSGIDAFMTSGEGKSELEKLKGGMDLYGQSLRRGEIPDEISRKATTLTNAFVDSMEKLKKNKNDENRKEARKALDIYLDFAKLTSSTDKTPAEQIVINGVVQHY